MTIMLTSILLFDIPTTLSKPVSPNTWKVRLILNYKKLKYETQWIPTVDIETTCRALGIPPTSTKPNGDPHYTLPALIDRSEASHPVVLSNSTPIIEYLEEAYPSPPGKELFPKGTTALQHIFAEFALRKILGFVPTLATMALYNSKPPQDQVHFRQRLEAAFGKPLEEIEKQGEERELAYQELEKTFTMLYEATKRNESGPFITGERVAFADFTFAGALIFVQLISPDELWAKVSSWEEGNWKHYLENFEGWMAVDNHP